jgi:[protein-PII] uridylyltransferase
VDIQTPDRLGLLYQILRGFAELDVDIALSRIATEKGAAIDSFYVTDSVGRKIKGVDRIRALQKALQKATSEQTAVKGLA